MAISITIEPCWTNFCSQKLKRRILATVGFNSTALRATQPKLHSMFCALILKIALSSCRADVVWPPRNCDLTPLYYYLWDAVKPETIDALKDNIREVIDEIQLHAIDNVLKNCRSCRLLHYQSRQPFEWNYFQLLTRKKEIYENIQELRFDTVGLLWGAAKDKCYADKPETIDALKENIAEIQLHTIDNVLKNWTDRLGYCTASRGSLLSEIIFHY